MNRLGPYEVGAELARGAMGVVYRARDPFLDRPLAIKVIGGDDFQDPEALERFRREALVLARLRHTHVVAVHGAGVSGKGHPYLVMDLVTGGSLAERIAHGPLSPFEAVRLTRQVAKAAAYAHTQGVLHRDIKPANVLLDEKGNAVLSDFGLAKLVGEDRLTQTGDILGTPSYMAPEQVQGSTEFSPAVDVYALGATLYRMLTGRPPLIAATTTELFMKVVEVKPPPASEFVVGIDEGLEEILARALEKSPAARYLSMEAFGEALEAWEQGAPAQGGLAGVGAARARARGRAIRMGAALLLGVVLGSGLGVALANPIQRARRPFVEAEELPEALFAIYQRGQSRHERDDYVGAKEDLVRVTVAEPACDFAWLGLGRTLIAMGERDEGLAALDRALELDPTTSSAWLERGKALHAAGRAEEAVVAFQKSVDANPAGAAQRISLAVGLRGVGKEAEAKLAWEESCRLDPRLGQNFAYQAVFSGLSPADQLPILDRGWEVDPTNEELLLLRARIRNQLGQVPEALAAYDDALRNLVPAPNLFVERGELLLTERRFAEGMSDLRVALLIDPENPTIRFKRGAWLFKNSRYGQCRSDLAFAEEHGSPEIAAAATKALAPIRASQARGDYMINQTTIFRDSLEKDAKVIGRLSDGDHVQLIHVSDGWAKIEVQTVRDGGRRGFVPQKAISLRVRLR